MDAFLLKFLLSDIAGTKPNKKNEFYSVGPSGGTHGEVANPGFEDIMTIICSAFDTAHSPFYGDFGDQKGNAWAQIALESNDQLRQSIAWAFS